MKEVVNLSLLTSWNDNDNDNKILRNRSKIFKLQDGDAYVLRKSYVAKNNVELIENNYYDFDFKDNLNKGKNEDKMYLKLIKYLESKDGYIVMATSEKATAEEEMKWYENVRENFENGE